MLKFLIICTFLSSSLLACSQVAKKETTATETKKEAKNNETKMEAFVSKTGVVIKFIDYNLNNIRLAYGGVASTRIRKLSNSTDSKYFFQIEKSEDYDNSTASIEYSDLIEVIKAIQTLKSEVEKDVLTNADYLENKFITEDGFQIGYFISKSKVSWYLKLEKYGSKGTLFLKDGDNIETVFNDAKLKIQEQKK